MAKNENKKPDHKPAGSFAERLAAQLRKSSPGDLGEQAAQQGISPEAFAGGFEKARALLKSGPDPRQVAQLPALFQTAFLKVFEQDGETDPITDLLAVTTDKEIRKEARRCLHRMRSRGLKADLPGETTGSVLDRRVVPEDPPLPCYLGPIDGSGHKLAFLARYVHGGVAVYQATLSDTDGLVDFAGGTIGRNRYRGIVKDLQGEEQHLLAVGYEEARLQVSRAAARSRTAGKALPEAYLEASNTLPEPGVEPALPDPAALFEDAVPGPDLVGKAAELHDHAELDTWQPDEETLQAFWKKFEEIRSSKIIVSEAQRLDQVRAVIANGAATLLGDPERRKRYQDRLLDLAVHFQRTGQAEPARLAAVAARHLTLEGFKPEDSAFFSRMVTKLFKSPEEIVKGMGEAPPSTPSAAEAPPDPGKLIVTP
jgi:hypothetical protein